MNKEFVVYNKRFRMTALSLISIIFVLLGIIFIFIALTEGPQLLLLLIGIIVIVFFGFSTLFLLREVFIRKPALIVSDEGIIDRSSYIGAGLVEWEDVQAIDFIKYGGQPFLAIYTFDKQLIIDRTNGLKRILNKTNRGLLDSQVNIPIKNLACNLDDLVQAINENWFPAEQRTEETVHPLQ